MDTVTTGRTPSLASEYKCGGLACVGLALAHEGRHLAVSFRSPSWEVDRVLLTETSLAEADGALVEQTADHELPHASTPIHVETWVRFLRESALDVDLLASDVWADRACLFPCLGFLARVEADLEGLERHELEQVCERLHEMNDACREWTLGTSAMPMWKSRVSPESKGRKGLCEFTDMDGVVRCFDLHARFTPGAGRVHFRLRSRSDVPSAVVAYIGQKLDAS